MGDLAMISLLLMTCMRTRSRLRVASAPKALSARTWTRTGARSHAHHCNCTQFIACCTLRRILYTKVGGCVIDCPTCEWMPVDCIVLYSPCKHSSVPRCHWVAVLSTNRPINPFSCNRHSFHRFCNQNSITGIHSQIGQSRTRHRLSLSEVGQSLSKVGHSLYLRTFTGIH